LLYGHLRGLCAGRAPADATARRTERSTQSWQWTSAMPCVAVRRRSPVVVVVA
jgi:hypothetical protein